MDVKGNEEFFCVLDAALVPMGRANGGRGVLCGRVLEAGRCGHVRSYGRRAAISAGFWGPRDLCWRRRAACICENLAAT